MPKVVLRGPKEFEQGFQQIRNELDIPDAFTPEVLAEAQASQPATVDRADARHIELVAVDPPGATDLDQAFAAETTTDGFRVFYAIADVGAFVQPGGLVDQEARSRGATMYSPDRRNPLHPPVISEDRASLLAGVDRPALLWTIDLDRSGEPTTWNLERATVKIREAISYAEAQARIDDGNPNLGLLKVIGQLRQEQETKRGGISLNLPAQEIVNHNGSYALAFDDTLAVEGWNAQISLLTGIVAARTMVDAKVGILRTLPPPFEQNIDQLRRTAQALQLQWPADVDYPQFVRELSPDNAASNAFMVQATRVFRGAGYEAFNGELPEHYRHGAIASEYAHVTAPLRRLVDRFANEILLALFAGDEPPSWAVEALDELPSLMGSTKQAESALERTVLDFAEALVLENHVGETFTGLVVDINEKREQATIQIADPAIVTKVPSEGRTLAEELTLTLKKVDVSTRTLQFHT